jgi:HAD superfamily hydrolase (TIGR01509 family)
MDGLLFDTERLREQAALAAAAELGYEMDSAFFRTTIGSPWSANRVRFLDRYGPTFAYDELRARAIRIFGELAEANLPLKPGALELLDLLDRLCVPRAIATTSSHAIVRHHLEAHGLIDRFNCVIAQGDYTRFKPSPDPFLKASERLGVAPALCLALEDSHSGVRSAAAAGMMTIMVPDLVPPTDEIHGLCAVVAVDLHDVRYLVESKIRMWTAAGCAGG